MADVKWIKLNIDMFSNHKIKQLRKLPDGNNIVLIWVMLLTMAGRCNAGGMIFLTENIPYTSKMLADELDFEENTVILALQALERFSMISSSGDLFSISGWAEHQNIDGMEKIKESKRLAQARWRAKQKKLLKESTVDSTVDSTEIKSDNAEVDKEEDLEERNKSVRETSHTLLKKLLPDFIIPDSLAEKVTEWITYKSERKESYKEQGMKSLLRQIENNQLTYGETAVIELIDESMANGWKGIIFDRLKNKPNKGYQKQIPDSIKNRVSDVDGW